MIQLGRGLLGVKRATIVSETLAETNHLKYLHSQPNTKSVPAAAPEQPTQQLLSHLSRAAA